MSSFDSASVWARLEMRSSSTVTGAWFDEFAIQVLLMMSVPTVHVLALGLPALGA